MSSNSVPVPNEYLCPISMNIMEEPVMAADGHTYDKQYIEQWFRICAHSGIYKSPKTNAILGNTNLVPNHNVRNLIEDWKQTTPLYHIVHQTPNTKTSNKKSIQQLTQEKYADGKNEILINAYHDANHKKYLIELVPPEEGKRTGIDLCFVVDISGSMQCSIDDKNIEVRQFSRLDVVKQALTAIISSMTDIDRVAIVTFSSKARIESGFMNMDETGMNRALDIVKNMRTEGATNLWDGILKAQKIVDEVPSEEMKRISAIMLLTDGEPSEHPAMGYDVEIKNMVRVNKCPLNVFGFGYVLDSELLAKIANAYNGTFCFIPEMSMVVTVFINMISKYMSTMATNINITVNGNNIPYEGTLQFGQKKYLLCDAPDDSYNVEVRAEYTSPYSVKKQMVTFKKEKYALIKARKELMNFHMMREEANILLTKICRNGKMQMENSNGELAMFLTKWIQNTNDIADELLKDLEGQVCQAISREDWFVRWGIHYIRSLENAHRNQYCANFKDPGLQLYKSEYFVEMQKSLNDIFNNLPSPTPSLKFSYNDNNNIPSTLASINNVDNGCFHPMAMIEMANGTTKRICDITNEDTVATPEGEARVIKITNYVTEKSKAIFVEFPSGLKLTRYHPVLVLTESFNTEWMFPIELYEQSEETCDVLYNLVLDKGHIVYANGVMAVTLGHGFRGEKIEHEFFGDKIVKDLEKFECDEKGRVFLYSKNFTRDPESGVVDGIVNV